MVLQLFCLHVYQSQKTQLYQICCTRILPAEFQRQITPGPKPLLLWMPSTTSLQKRSSWEKKQVLQLVLPAAFQAYSYLYPSFQQNCSTVNLLCFSWTSAQTSASPKLIPFPLTFAAFPSVGFSFSQEELPFFQLGWEKINLSCRGRKARRAFGSCNLGYPWNMKGSKGMVEAKRSSTSSRLFLVFSRSLPGAHINLPTLIRKFGPSIFKWDYLKVLFYQFSGQGICFVPERNDPK